MSLLRHGWKIPNMDCLRYQCFYLCLQAIDVNPSFFSLDVIKRSSNKEICHPITVHTKWAKFRAKIRSNLGSRKKNNQAALSLEFSIYSFVELALCNSEAIFRTKHHISTYMWITSLLFITFLPSSGTDPVVSVTVPKSLFKNVTE